MLAQTRRDHLPPALQAHLLLVLTTPYAPCALPDKSAHPPSLQGRRAVRVITLWAVQLRALPVLRAKHAQIPTGSQ